MLEHVILQELLQLDKEQLPSDPSMQLRPTPVLLEYLPEQVILPKLLQQDNEQHPSDH